MFGRLRIRARCSDSWCRTTWSSPWPGRLGVRAPWRSRYPARLYRRLLGTEMGRRPPERRCPARDRKGRSHCMGYARCPPAFATSSYPGGSRAPPRATRPRRSYLSNSVPRPASVRGAGRSAEIPGWMPGPFFVSFAYCVAVKELFMYPMDRPASTGLGW